VSSSALLDAEGVVLTTLVVGAVVWYLVTALARSRPEFHVGAPVLAGVAIRLAAVAGIGATGLNSTLRGGDELTFLGRAQFLAAQPLGHGTLPHGVFQLHTDLFALLLKLGFLTEGALRVTQVGIATVGAVLILAAVYDLGGGRAARVAAWLIAFEPAAIFFNSALHKEPLMQLAVGLIVFGGTMIWLRLDVRGILLCGLGGLIAVETRPYAGWFLVSAAVLLLLHAALRNLDRPVRAMPAIYAVAIIAFAATPSLLQASSEESLKPLQQSQDANAAGAGQGTGGANSSNLALERVNLSTRSAIVKDLPKRIRDLLIRPYPWQLGNSSQRLGAVGTLVAYAIFLLLVRYAWLNRGAVFARAGPVLYPLLFMLVAYSLSVGNAGTGFRYRSHLVTLAIAAMVILREHALTARSIPRDRGEPYPAHTRIPVDSPAPTRQRALV
jgi:hypothetical protein